MKRIEQKIGEVNDKTLRSLFKQYQTIDEIAIFLDIPRVIIENIKIYWGL